jgi:hypothetical protein
VQRPDVSPLCLSEVWLSLAGSTPVSRRVCHGTASGFPALSSTRGGKHAPADVVWRRSGSASARRQCCLALSLATPGLGAAPPAVQAYLLAVQHDLAPLRDLHNRVEALEARLTPDSTTSQRPPSSDQPYTKPHRRSTSATPRTAGGQPGPGGHRQGLWPPTVGHELQPERGGGGHRAFGMMPPYQPPHGLARPPIAMASTPWVVSQGCGRGCGTWRKAPLPPEPATGEGPRCSALSGARAGP